MGLTKIKIIGSFLVIMIASYFVWNDPMLKTAIILALAGIFG